MDSIPDLQWFRDHPCLWVTHRQADGDAIGSLLGMTRMLQSLGVEAVAYHPDPIQPRLRKLMSQEILTDRARAMDLLDDGLFLGVLDCGDMERICDEALRKAGPMIEIDHHDSNPHYALVNLVDPQASSTAELVWRVGESLNVQWNVKIGDPLWVGLVTDTNGFGYDKAGVNSHLMAVDLIKAGVKPHEWRAELWGRATRSLLRMRGRVIEDMTELWNGSVVIGWTSRDSLNELGLSPAQVVDVVDDLRDIEGVKIAIAGKPLEDGGWKMSVRTDSDELDVSALARTFNGGGHRAASGWLWSGNSDELTQRIITECQKLYGFEAPALPEAVTGRAGNQ